MKKRFKVILSLAFAVCLCFALTACGGLFGFGSGNNSGSYNSGNSSGSSGSNSGSSSSGGSSAPKEDNDGTFIYTGASVKAANTSISGDITIPAERNGTPNDTIPADAFKACNAITSITVPESVTTIGAGAFNGCSSLRSITLPFVGGQKGNSDEKAACFGYIFGSTSYLGSTRILQYYSVSHSNWYDEYYIPSILRSVTITNETVINRGAFQNCSMLTEINLNDKIIQVGVSSFSGCSKIEEINLPSIFIIPSSLFSECISLGKFTINSSVETIGQEAFKNCRGLSSINSESEGTFIIPNCVTSIGYGAFNGCSSIRSMTLPFVGSQKGNSDEKAACFGYIFGSTSYQGSTRILQYYSVSHSNWYDEYYIPSILHGVTITNETVINRGAFQNCSMLQSITINRAAQSNVATNAFDNTATPTWV